VLQSKRSRLTPPKCQFGKIEVNILHVALLEHVRLIVRLDYHHAI
jgi:hypothetical protein